MMTTPEHKKVSVMPCKLISKNHVCTQPQPAQANQKHADAEGGRKLSAANLQKRRLKQARSIEEH